MTTKVNIENMGPDSVAVFSGNDQVGTTRRLLKGDSMEQYVHQYSHIEIREVKDNVDNATN